LQTLPALKCIRLQWLKHSHNLVGYKKLDVIYDEPHRKMELEGVVMYKAKPGAEMYQNLEELKRRLVVKDHKFLQGSDSSDVESEGNENESSENEDEAEPEDGGADGMEV
jgi:hypothetical protein